MRSAVRALIGAAALLALGGGAAGAVSPPGSAAPGPPYPPPVENVVVYDHADVFSPDTEASATRTIVAIEERVGAEIVVYSQVKPGATTDSTEQDAIALIDQYGVGRQGFDDGVAILFNMDQSLCHGQVQLYAGPGYRATFLSNSERQQIFDEEMLPLLRECDLDGALLVALERIDANATPEHARKLELARIVDAAIGLIGAPIAFLLLVGAAGRSWLRYGKDPVYLDSPSILMPAPPPDLTAASGAVVWEGRTSRRALTTALLDLASRGELSFRPEHSLLRTKAGIELSVQPATDPYTIRNRRRPVGPAETYLLERLHGLAKVEESLYLGPEALEALARSVGTFDERLEKHVAKQGWFREPPHKAVNRWAGRGGLVIAAGIATLVLAFNLPSGGLTVLGGALIAAGVVMIVVARVMPARTMAGAMIYAMLAAYRRTLQATMAQARSMEAVVEQAQLEWLETPDQAVVWGVALGLHEEVESVLQRSVDDSRKGIAGGTYVPAWYGGSAAGTSSPSGSWGGVAPGLLSASAVPDFGGMMSALGNIGSAPSSSGDSGGFSGGSSGGGGGGSGGGF